MATAQTNRELLRKKQYARQKAHHAEKNGTLLPPAKCQHCGRKGEKLCKHHPDYDKPLDVFWVCTFCHSNHHESLPGGKKPLQITFSGERGKSPHIKGGDIRDLRLELGYTQLDVASEIGVGPKCVCDVEAMARPAPLHFQAWYKSKKDIG